MDDKLQKFITTVKFNTENFFGVVQSSSFGTNSSRSNIKWIDTYIQFEPSKEFKDNVTISICDKNGKEVLNQDTLGSVYINADEDYFKNLRSKSILAALGDSYRMAIEDIRCIQDIDASVEELAGDKNE